MSFKKDHYQVIKKVISKDMAHYFFNYLRFRRHLLWVLREERCLIHALDDTYGSFGDNMFKEKIYCVYGDPALECLLVMLKPKMEKITGLSLVPTYSYARIYEKGNELFKHKDRIPCEFSTTLNLGGEIWPIYLENKKIILKPGDMLVYKGEELEHWRKPLPKGECGQVFFHYNDVKRKDKEPYDGRVWLGMPHICKK
tara:strand:- start:1728 stop:2321 length:594 start_codon:yes stop_codon:yes gene_type:complete